MQVYILVIHSPNRPSLDFPPKGGLFFGVSLYFLGISQKLDLQFGLAHVFGKSLSALAFH
jgi:hypothetical protein